MSALAAAQAWMQAAVLGADAGDAQIQLTRSSRMSAAERLELYRGMIAMRFEECLREDFPRLCAALGPEAWTALVADYLRACPSRHYSLNRLGQALPEFVRERCKGEHGARLAELAELERAHQEVFDAPEHAVARAADLAGVSPDAWAGMRLRLIPALRLCREPFGLEASPESPASQPPPSPWRLVYRSRERVWCVALTPEQHALLLALQSGQALGGALDAAAAVDASSPATLARAVRGWFETWAAEGIFLPPGAAR